MGGPSTKAQLIIASALLIGFGAVVVLMLAWAETWEQRVYVFGAVEAIVFTAVGWVFGREVHRQSAETAKEDAAEAKQDAKAKTEEVKGLAVEAEKGRALALAVKNTVAAAPADGEPRDSSAEPLEGISLPPTTDDGLAALRRLAADMYE